MSPSVSIKVMTNECGYHLDSRRPTIEYTQESSPPPHPHPCFSEFLVPYSNCRLIIAVDNRKNVHLSLGRAVLCMDTDKCQSDCPLIGRGEVGSPYLGWSSVFIEISSGSSSGCFEVMEIFKNLQRSRTQTLRLRSTLRHLSNYINSM